MQRRVYRSHLQPCPQPTPVPARFTKEVVRPSVEKISVSPDVKCVVVEETWRTAEGQSIPSGHEWVECSSTLVDVLDVPEFEEQESADETIMAVERSVDEEGDGVEVIPMDLVPDAVRKHPVPAPRSKLAAPVEPRIPVPVPRRSQRQRAGKHSNLYSLPTFFLNFWPAW